MCMYMHVHADYPNATDYPNSAVNPKCADYPNALGMNDYER